MDYFSLHALQRLLLITVVPVLLLRGNPAPVLQAGMPPQWQTRLAALPQTASRFGVFLIRVTSPVPVWFLFVCTYWLWHDVQVNRLVLQLGWLHRLENVTLLGTAVLLLVAYFSGFATAACFHACAWRVGMRRWERSR